MSNCYGIILEHSGIKGQKWGVRRYQNPDGTLTAEGRLRLGRNNARQINRQVREYGKLRQAKSEEEKWSQWQALRAYGEMAEVHNRKVAGKENTRKTKRLANKAMNRLEQVAKSQEKIDKLDAKMGDYRKKAQSLIDEAEINGVTYSMAKQYVQTGLYSYTYVPGVKVDKKATRRGSTDENTLVSKKDESKKYGPGVTSKTYKPKGMSDAQYKRELKELKEMEALDAERDKEMFDWERRHNK